MRKRCSGRAWLVALLATLTVATGLRFHALNWDQFIGAHPDERFVVGVATSLSFPNDLNPFDTAPQFAYGHLPLYLLALARMVAPGVDSLLVARALSAAFDVGTVMLTFALGRRACDERVGLLAAALLGLMVAHVQQAHFYTADVLLVFFVVGTLLFAVRYARDGEARDAWLAGAAAGMALGTKVAAALLVFPLGVAFWSPSGPRKGAAWRCGVAVVLTFLILDPFAVIELPTFLRNVRSQAAIVRGTVDVPYTRQYHGTTPYLYPLVQQLRWGMGWLMGSWALAGVAYAVVRAVRRPLRPGGSVLLGWLVPFFLFVGGLYAKFPRYLLPVLPLLAIYAARLMVDVGRWRGWLPPALVGLVVTALLLRCLALAAMYRAPHPWVAASAWVYDHVERGSTIAIEAWDHPLPLNAEGYVHRELPIFAEETPQKWETIDQALEEADYVIVASRRGYGTLARWPERYERMARTYQGLFEGGLGFEPVACFGRHPRLGSLVLVDDPTAGLAFSLPAVCGAQTPVVLRLGRLDESFVAYDHPQVIIFRAAR